jgi:phosphoribosylanthranilate isomerase
MLVKICGLRTVEHALAAADAGAAMLGLVFAPSRRRVTLEQAATIAQAVRSKPGPRPELVGLFVNAPAEEMNAVSAAVGLDRVQLSGDEPVSLLDELRLPALKAVRMDGSANELAWIERAGANARRDNFLPGVVLLVDAHVPGAYGGTGVQADWGRAAALARRAPLLLAGGLSPLNVAAAIAAVAPLGVDVSSGVERDGAKDTAKIEAFIGAAHAAH